MSKTNEMMCFWVGIGVGASAALLFAPQSGIDTRQFLQSKARRGTDSLRDQTNAAIGAATEAVDRGAKSIRHQKENLVAAVEAGRSAYDEASAATPAN